MLRLLTPGRYHLRDHGGGFDPNLRNQYLDSLQSSGHVTTEYQIDSLIQKNYPHLEFGFDVDFKKDLLGKLESYSTHPDRNFKNFLCSFNGSDHVSRKLLTAALHSRGWFAPGFCTKNFVFELDRLDGHISDYVGSDSRLYRKFFLQRNIEQFASQVYAIDSDKYDHARNVLTLEHALTQSFLHIVTESLATSYYPFVTEKFLYSVVTRGLFLAYAQPGWHYHLEHYYGFQKYRKIFDYRFDQIQNPVERLIELMSMISKFSVLSSDDWQDLYEMESDTIEHNYDHYFSGQYLKMLEANE